VGRALSARRPEPLLLDGSHGEGGGQLVRTAVALAALTGRSLRIERVRAGRPRPGLAPQHLTAVRAAASLCAARLQGDTPRSGELAFVPTAPVRSGWYELDVSAAGAGTSAGAVTLVLQTVLPVLATAEGDSTLVLRGGTHMAWSPTADYVRDVWLPTLRLLGIESQLEIERTGWWPRGGGELRAHVHGLGLRAPRVLRPLVAPERPAPGRAWGRALAANLPSHIPQRMADRARSLLESAGLRARVDAERLEADCPGAGLTLTVECGGLRAGASALGRPGLPAERVAEQAAKALHEFLESGATVDEHLADQLLLPLALVPGRSTFSVQRVTTHLETVAWVIERFGLASVTIRGGDRTTGTVEVDGGRIGPFGRSDLVEGPAPSF
jgi:RNA 3'-terminal phosphate cyclase (ATP)